MSNGMMLAFLGWGEVVCILAILLLLFGAKKLPELARGLGKGIQEFKKATQEVQSELERVIEEPPPPRPVNPPANQTVSTSQGTGSPSSTPPTA